MKISLKNEYEIEATRVYRTLNTKNKNIDLTIETANDIFDDIIKHLNEDSVSMIKVTDTDTDITKEYEGYKLESVFDNVLKTGEYVTRISLSKPLDEN